MADQLFQTFPRVLRPLFATLPLFTTFFVYRISLVVNIVKGCRLIEGVYIIRMKNFCSDNFYVRLSINWIIINKLISKNLKFFENSK